MSLLIIYKSHCKIKIDKKGDFMEKVIIKASDGYNLNVHVFDVSKPKGFIQIISI